ncbi:MAG: nuclear transport factor 2 family protein, partial [Ruminiclostridium sp.]|nr:nuclear transport factor 2 family protein [Ruminiclostridium sp.]
MIFELENKMWQAAKDGDKTAFAELVSDKAVMVCGGYRCSGAEYGSFIGDFGIASYEIKDFETVLESDNVIQVHYIVRTIAATPEYSDMAGL